MRSSAVLSLLVSLAMAGPVEISKRAGEPVSAQITRVGNTGVKVTLTNTGTDSIKLFVPGTILDPAPVEKVTVISSNAISVPFDGVRLRLAPPDLITGESFKTIAPKEVLNLSFDFGQMHDLTAGGNYDITAVSSIPYAKGGSTKIEGYIPIMSNTLSVKNVNGTQAGITRRDFHLEAKRVAIQAGCTRQQNTMVNDALIHCTNLATDAARAAMNNEKKMKEYFKTFSNDARRAVSLTMTKVANECRSRLAAQSVSSLYCTDVYSSCKDGVLAYTVPSLKYMVNCPLYFNRLPSLTKTCHAQDQATTTLHEMTHLTQIRGTLDWGVYGYDAIKTLPSEKNLFHADTFCLFANWC
ncbi:Neutral protease 2-like protein [Colletotrichum spinosum]|uniref:Neutral protease 2 n=1 Tax=Colletotrichum spinosum TaxID=1347390 RepID=A0A4R8QBM9_9PEZI|nr:Neutral protease 2-like protein [Colletotrichum spinosum]